MKDSINESNFIENPLFKIKRMLTVPYVLSYIMIGLGILLLFTSGVAVGATCIGIGCASIFNLSLIDIGVEVIHYYCEVKGIKLNVEESARIENFKKEEDIEK